MNFVNLQCCFDSHSLLSSTRFGLIFLKKSTKPSNLVNTYQLDLETPNFYAGRTKALTRKVVNQLLVRVL